MVKLCFLIALLVVCIFGYLLGFRVSCLFIELWFRLFLLFGFAFTILNVFVLFV